MLTPELVARQDQRVPRYTSYPTAPHFKADVGPQTYAAWLRAIDPDATLSLYLHIPFCAQLCLYCGCNTSVAGRYEPIAAYVGALKREIALAARHLRQRMRVSHVHWGGGTPTMLSPRDMMDVARHLHTLFAISANAEAAIEIDPRQITEAHMDALAECGFTRASLGVQDFDPLVQKTINRVQSFERTAHVAQALRSRGIASLNLDLMYGLPHQTVEGVVRSVETALAIDPDRIALFGYAHVPWIKKHQTLLPQRALPGGADRVRQMQAAADAITRKGYVAIGIDHFAKPDDALARRGAEGALHRNFQGYTADGASTLIGFGASAIGALPQGYAQNAPRTTSYREAVMAGRFATTRGFALSDEDRLRRAIIERLMCDFEVDLDAVTHAFERGPRDLAESLERIGLLERQGLVATDGARIVIPPHARPLARVVCAGFDAYLPQDATRYSAAI